MRAKAVDTENPVFEPPFLGERHLKGISLDDISRFINQTALFRMQWRYKPEKSINETDADFKKRIGKILNKWLNQAKAKNLLQPAVAYGYFPANSKGDDLLIFEDDSRGKVLETFNFPRQTGGDRLCIADFFKPEGSPDYAAFSLVTMGPAVTQEANKLFESDSYTDYLHLHGLGVEMTEALAEYFHQRIRQEWGFADEDGPTLGGLFRQKYRGGRYSWGYSACPDLEDNEKAGRILKAEKLGVEVSEETSWQFHPEQTTAAIICHHPQAKYFNTP